jgi:hypothetical protein
MRSMGTAVMDRPDMQELVERTLRENEQALEQADEAKAKLKAAVEESDKRVGPAVTRLRRAGLLADA